MELWNDETNQESLMVCRRDDNLSPGETKKEIIFWQNDFAQVLQCSKSKRSFR